MKTVTELSGFAVQDAFEIRKSIAPEPAPAASNEGPAVEQAVTEQAATDQPEDQPSETAKTEVAPADEIAATAPETAAPEETPADATVAPVEVAAPAAHGSPRHARGRDRNRGRNRSKPNVQPRPQLPPMTDEMREKLKSAITEKMKIEGDKLNFLVAALEVVGFKTRDLKRVVVYTATEEEKVPSNIIKQGEHYFRAEYMAPLERPKGRDDRGAGRFGKFGKGGGRGGRGRGGKGRGDRDRRPGGGHPGGKPSGPRPNPSKNSG